MEVEIQYRGAAKFDAIARGHRVICDQPVSNGGEDAGMTPPEFLLASLGTCAGFYAAQYLKTRSLPTEPLAVKVTAEKVPQPARLGRFHLEVTAPALDPQHEAGLMRAVKACLIHNTMLHPPEIEIALHAHADALA
jgi:putative redox protein